MKNVSISLRNNANKRGDKFSPCLSPTCDSKNSDYMPLAISHDLMDLYIFNITRRTFPDIPHDISFFQRIALLIESNALL